MTRLVFAAACIAASSVALAADEWALRLPKEEKVVFRGVVSMDGAGLPGAPMMYPAPNVIGLLAAIATHGLISEAARQDQKNKLQEAADKVLAPYGSILERYTHKALMLSALEKMPAGGARKVIEPQEKPSAGWLIESAPVFSLTQDQGAIILDNAVLIQKVDAAQTAPYAVVIRVVSRPAQAPDLAAFWTANDGEKLKERSAALLAASVELALGEMARAPGAVDPPQRTVRYMEGGAEKMERAQVLGDNCNRLLIKNLRGWLLSVPGRSDAQAGAEPCATEGP